MSEFNPDKIALRMEDIGEDWADKRAAYQALDDLTKTVLSEIKRTFTGSDAAATTEALADDRYKQHLADVDQARAAFLRAEVKWKNIQTWAELKRTEQSNLRAHLK